MLIEFLLYKDIKFYRVLGEWQGLDRLTVPVEVDWIGWNGVSYRLPLV